MARILVVDDEGMLRGVLRKMLERSGHEVFEAADGVLGANAYRTLRTDVVITDIVMPNKDGIQLIIELKKEFPDVRLIAMSGGARTSERDFLEVAKQYGVRQVLHKPFSRAELETAIRAVQLDSDLGTTEAA
jgi:YesN/AraC family two-component response regulator